MAIAGGAQAWQQGEALLRRALAMASAETREAVLLELAEIAREASGSPFAAVWWIDRKSDGFALASASGLGSVKFERFHWKYESVASTGVLTKEPFVLIHPESLPFALPVAQNPLRLMRIHFDGHTPGIVAVGVDEPDPPHGRILASVVDHGAIVVRNLTHRVWLARLVDALQLMHETRQETLLLRMALQCGMDLLECDRGVVRRTDLQTGQTEVKVSRPSTLSKMTLKFGEGVTGKALADKKTYRIDDVTSHDWSEIYRPLWTDLSGARSELAVPILLANVAVQVGLETGHVDKAFGVLNFESPCPAAFSTFDEQVIGILAKHTARILERIDLDQKLERLRTIERTLGSKRDWDSKADLVVEAIRTTLGYEYVNLSLVEPEINSIRCVRVFGLEDNKGFLNDAHHPLDGNDMQADIVRSNRVEVPAKDDPRLDPALLQKYGLDAFVRVFVPMFSTMQRAVLGTISAGYRRELRPHIYARDIQILKAFVDYTTAALDLTRRGMLDRLSHELNAPLTAIRANITYMQRRWKILTEERTMTILDDLQTDVDLLRFHVAQLEYVVGGIGSGEQPLVLEPVLLFRDLIFKTINQLKPFARDKGLDPSGIGYEEADVNRVARIHVDKGRISQVLFNLLINSIKYAEEKEGLKVLIGAEDLGDRVVVKFRDWGIGVPHGLEEKIFDEGFRAPSAVSKRNVSGSGFGLFISRKIMREHGGDLVLAHHLKPTEFQIVIPRRER